MDEQILRDTLKACLSQADFPIERQRAVLHAVRKDESRMKRTLPAALVCALVLLLALGGAALAAGLGVFGQSAETNQESANRLMQLDTAASALDTTQTASAPDAPASSPAAQTVHDTMLSNLYARRFQLTLNQAYTDGRKLYYAYTLTTDAPLAQYSGEGMPSGFDSWNIAQPGTYAEHYTAYYEEDQLRLTTFFAEHPTGYIGHESMSLGDGADLGDVSLNILDSGETRIDERTIQGYQEVELPEGFTPEDEIEIELTILYGATMYAQDADNVYWAHIATPENRGILRLPFTVPLNGETTVLCGALASGDYVAQATLYHSDVDISGDVIFTLPKGSAPANPLAQPPIADYALVADGVAYPNLDSAIRVNDDGQYVLSLRYDLPASGASLLLAPVVPEGDARTAECIPLNP